MDEQDDRTDSFIVEGIAGLLPEERASEFRDLTTLMTGGHPEVLDVMTLGAGVTAAAHQQQRQRTVKSHIPAHRIVDVETEEGEFIGRRILIACPREQVQWFTAEESLLVKTPDGDVEVPIPWAFEVEEATAPPEMTALIARRVDDGADDDSSTD